MAAYCETAAGGKRYVNAKLLSKTGNNTNAPQNLYVKLHIPFIWRMKVGVSGSIWRRTKQTSRDVFGFYVPIAYIWIPFAYPLSSSFCPQLNDSVAKYSGKVGAKYVPGGLVCPLPS